MNPGFLTRNEKVIGSIPIGGSSKTRGQGSLSALIEVAQRGCAEVDTLVGSTTSLLDAGRLGEAWPPVVRRPLRC